MTKDEQAMWNRLSDPEPEIDKNGTQRWFNKAGQLHRENDMPATIGKNRIKAWYINGKLHRDNDLPAIIWENGEIEYWIYGMPIFNSETQWWFEVKTFLDYDIFLIYAFWCVLIGQ